MTAQTTLSQPHSPPPVSLADFFPGYFALVMATGMVSLVWRLLGSAATARALLALNVVQYGVLWGCTLRRLGRYPARLWTDLTGPTRGPLFFTLVAATQVLGTQVLTLTPWRPVAVLLWWLGLSLWALLTYTWFTALALRTPKPTLAQGLSGAWLLMTVATEATGVLAALLAAPSTAEALLLVSLSAYLLGGLFYLLFIPLLVYRWLFLPQGLERLDPAAWLTMGAAAITTLAGSQLLLAARDHPWLAGLSPFLTGFTLLFWVAGTWWIPLLLAVFAWGYGWARAPLRYDPAAWTVVFPLAMYGVATFTYAEATGLTFLKPLALAVGGLAIGAWTLTFFGLLTYLIGVARAMRRPR